MLSSVGRAGEKGVSWKMRLSQLVCWTAVVAAGYSASHVDSASTFCLEDVQPIGERFRVCSAPV